MLLFKCEVIVRADESMNEFLLVNGFSRMCG